MQEVPDLSPNSTMIAYYPPLEFSKKLAIPEGIDPTAIHLSICVFNTASNTAINTELLDTTLKAFTASCHPLPGKISGVGRFTNADKGMDAFYASADVHHLHKKHDHLVKTLLEQGFPVDMLHSYDPHFTLKYIPSDSPMPEQTVPNISFTISSLFLIQGDKKTEYLFTGLPHNVEAEEEYMNLDNLPPDQFDYLTLLYQGENCAWPDAPGGPKYVVRNQQELEMAAKLLDRAPKGKQEAIKTQIVALALKNGLPLPESIAEAKWTTAARKAYLKDHPENFAGPDGSFPIRDASDVGDAWGLAGHADNPDAVRAKIKSIAKRLGLEKGLPATAKEDAIDMQLDEKSIAQLLPAQKAKEVVLEDVFKPKSRIAQLKVRFLSDNAISRNGRQYPPTTVHKLVTSGQTSIISGDILNSYICHGVADEDNPLVVSGKATKIWHEGDGAYALFDVPDTSTGRDMVSLLTGGYIPPTMSLRASNAEMRVEKGKGVPQVVGDNITLLGIDFTARPGIEDARIQDLVLENAALQGVLTDSFYVESLTLLDEKEENVEDIVSEETQVDELHPNQTLKPQASGNSQSTDGPAGSEYTKKYPQLKAGPPAGLTDIGALADGPPSGLTDIGGLQHASAAMETSRSTHDHIAAALGMSCAPGMSESGRKFNQVAEKHMVQVHDMHARQLGLDCVGSYQQMQNPKATAGEEPPDKDDKMETAQKPAKEEKKAMSVEEALVLLKQQNYDVTPPKTEAQKIQEVLEAKLEEQQRKFEEQTKALQEEQTKKLEEITKLLSAQQPAAQRKSLVESTTNERKPVETPRSKRSFIQEQLMKADWEQLADRSSPLPDGITPEHILRHFGQLMIMQYNDKYGVGSIAPANS